MTIDAVTGDINMLINRMGGRTFLLTVGCGITTTVLCWYGKIDGTTYAAVVLGTVGAYITANAVRGVKQDKTGVSP
ncbi:hypothetical protein [Polaromonas sp. YR568]|uniref:hypothetical protein n=1 Tax=Polaromonas sp. YR568 TaxID=1855301 RepID=UPI00313817BD